MPQFARALDVYQGFNYKKDKQTAVGFITKLKVGDIEFAANIESVKDPTAPTSDVKVVAVLNNYMWATGTTDALYLSGQITVKNKNEMAQKLLGGFTDFSVELNYVIYEYDPLEKKYFKSNFVDSDLKGVLEKNGEDLNLAVADDASTEVQSPKNYTFQIGVKPKSEEQAINLAMNSSAKVVKKWGIKES